MSGETGRLPLPTPLSRLLRSTLIAGAVCLLALLPPAAAEAAAQETAQETDGRPPADAADPPLATPLQRYLQQDAAADLHPETAAVYEARGYGALWIGPDRRSRQTAGELLEAITHADEYGLDADDYAAERLSRELSRLSAASDHGLSDPELARLDAEVTSAYLHFTEDLYRGRLSPEDVRGDWHLEAREVDLAQHVADSLGSEPTVAEALAAAHPPHSDYHALMQQHRRYRRLAADGGWPTVPDGPVLEEGDEVAPERFRALVRRLEVEGYLDTAAAEELTGSLGSPRAASPAPPAGAAATGRGAGAASDSASTSERALASDPATAADGATAAPASPTYGPRLADAVRRFQDRHGIREDGKVGPNTQREMNVPAAQRVRQIALNLERWRWLPADLGRHVQVNLPDFQLRAVDGDRVVHTMDVVIGKEGWETPVLSESMERVVVNPYWNIPDSILQADLLPEIRRDPGYLASRNMEVVDLGSGEVIPASAVDWAAGAPGVRVRERPGPGNALGQIKFLFPNRFNVYLHDSPAESAFEQTFRDLSHGCVRVEDPLALAGFVFAGDPDWDQGEVRRRIDGGEHEVIELDRPLPVYFLYWTAFVDAEGRMNFRPDLYGYDEAHLEALDAV